MNIDLETLTKWRDALLKQYQLHGDYSVTPRASVDAPSIRELSAIRNAHLNIYYLVNEVIMLRRLIDNDESHVSMDNFL